MATLLDYRTQATSYDQTRRASSSLGAALRGALGAPDGTLLDVGGGTGNYSALLREGGWRPLVLDRSVAMLERARAKDLPGVCTDATALPLGDRSVSAVLLVSMIHLVPDWRSALAEVRRVVRPTGKAVLYLYSGENLAVHWIFDYFPSAREWVWAEHQTTAEIVAHLPGAAAAPFFFEDVEDCSLAAMCRRPELFLEARYRSQTSFFERLARKDPEGLASGLAHLEDDLRQGRRPDLAVDALRRQIGDGTIVEWLRAG